MPEPCAHQPVAQTTPRIPLRYGSATWDQCALCGAWRTTHHKPGAWQPASTLDQALQEDDNL